MRIATLSTVLLFAIACRPAEGVLVDDPTSTGTLNPADDTNTDPNDDPSDDPNDDPVDVPADEPATWEGTREYAVGGEWAGDLACEDELNESGVEVTLDPMYADAVAACPICDHVFRIEVEEEFLCVDVWNWASEGLPVRSPTFRGLAIGTGGNAVIYTISEDDSGDWHREELADGEIVGDELEYEYEGRFYGAPYVAEGYAEIIGLKP